MELRKQYEKLLTGKMQYKFTNLGISLLFSRLTSRYSNNPTPEELIKCLEEINIFVTKYDRIVAKELAVLAEEKGV